MTCVSYDSCTVPFNQEHLRAGKNKATVAGTELPSPRMRGVRAVSPQEDKTEEGASKRRKVIAPAVRGRPTVDGYSWVIAPSDTIFLRTVITDAELF